MATQDFLGTSIQTVGWFKSRFDAGELEMAPPYQRNPVWLQPQKSLLIDSILQGYPIPELYMQEVVAETGDTRYVVVDGQQRVTSCLEFAEGKYELTTKENSKWEELTFEDLSGDEKKRFFSYKFVVRMLPEMSEEKIRTIFQRINRNSVVLNQQELRHATYWGEFITTIDKIADYQFWTESGIFTPNDFRRMLDREFISELAIGVLHGPQNKKLSLDKWYQAYEEEFDDAALLSSIFGKVVGELSQILPDIKVFRWRKKSDFYSLFLVFASHHKSLPLPSDRRSLAREILIEFAEKVDSFLTLNNPEQVEFSSEVSRYSIAVQRAASDLANRRVRAQQLETILQAVWQAASAGPSPSPRERAAATA